MEEDKSSVHRIALKKDEWDRVKSLGQRFSLRKNQMLTQLIKWGIMVAPGFKSDREAYRYQRQAKSLLGYHPTYNTDRIRMLEVLFPPDEPVTGKEVEALEELLRLVTRNCYNADGRADCNSADRA